MKLKDLKDFKPERFAKIETNTWKAYYRHNFFTLTILLLQLAREQFHVSYFHALRISYPFASATIYFRKNRGKENKDIILEKLTEFYKSINAIVVEKFDYKKTAELELEWWFVDRYPEKYKVSRREALRNSMASMYNVHPQGLTEYAEYRAKAMELQDEAEKENNEANWGDVYSLLLISYESLYKAIH
jgi:hypothetical protein